MLKRLKNKQKSIKLSKRYRNHESKYKAIEKQKNIDKIRNNIIKNQVSENKRIKEIKKRLLNENQRLERHVNQSQIMTQNKSFQDQKEYFFKREELRNENAKINRERIKRQQEYKNMKILIKHAKSLTSLLRHKIESEAKVQSSEKVYIDNRNHK